MKTAKAAKKKKKKFPKAVCEYWQFSSETVTVSVSQSSRSSVTSSSPVEPAEPSSSLQSAPLSGRLSGSFGPPDATVEAWNAERAERKGCLKMTDSSFKVGAGVHRCTDRSRQVNRGWSLLCLRRRSLRNHCLSAENLQLEEGRVYRVSFFTVIILLSFTPFPSIIHPFIPFLYPLFPLLPTCPQVMFSTVACWR